MINILVQKSHFSRKHKGKNPVQISIIGSLFDLLLSYYESKHLDRDDD